jgi:hypothetical protein
MSGRRRAGLYLGLAALALAAARPVEARLDALRQEKDARGYSLAAFTAGARGGRAAGAVAVRCLGGLRGILADLLWMRALRMEDEGRHYEIIALLDSLLEMQPHFASVWAFQAHVLAFDFASPAVEPDRAEAFRWIQRGIGVLEKGLERNPTSYLLEERLGQIYMQKLSPFALGPEWKSMVGMLNAALSRAESEDGSQDAPGWRTLREVRRQAAREGRPPPGLDNYTGLRLAREHLRRAAAKPEISPARKLLWERMAIRCLERMGDWVAAEREWRELFERQGRRDPNRFFQDFMRNLVIEHLLMGQVTASREAFTRMRSYFPGVVQDYGGFLADEVRARSGRGDEARARDLYKALLAAEPGETRSYEELIGPAGRRPEPRH